MMPELFLIPVIDVLEVHDAVIRDWLIGLDENTIKKHLEYPFRLERFFPESGRHALVRADSALNELISLFNMIDPQAVFLDISTDLYDLENKYNQRLISPYEFWLDYYENVSKDISEPAKTLYRIYLCEIIDKNIRLIESKERLPMNVLFFGVDIRSKEELIPVYEEIFKMVEEFTLQIARTVNEIMNLREKPKHIWYSSFSARHAGISYEETEKFYDELLSRLKRLLKYKARQYFVRILLEKSKAYVKSYENFLIHKATEDEIKFSNIIEGLNLLRFQSERAKVVILCNPMDYNAIFDFLKKENTCVNSEIFIKKIDLTRLHHNIKPFIQKNRIMQSNYEIALNILKHEKPSLFSSVNTVI